MAQPPVLPHGSSSMLSALSETFSFHSSPESFITSRVLAFRKSHPSLADSRTPIRAKVLNRNVAVVSSYEHVKQILSEEAIISNLSSAKAYDELMAPFFPAPNLLLSDPPGYQQMKLEWKARIEDLPRQTQNIVSVITRAHFTNIESGTEIDLYESMKMLSWKLLLSIFLSHPSNPQQRPEGAAEIERLQDQLLKGQFSLFPVSINTRLWQSPRSKGLDARVKLQKILKSRVLEQQDGCPFKTSTGADSTDVASHLLLFTSSLAAKALASLLTAVMMNVFIYSSEDDGQAANLASRISALPNETDRSGLITSIIKETERLSPPVVGIMRRTRADVLLSPTQNNDPPTLIPKDWDTWLYFVGAGRDPAVFGESADTFLPDRFPQSPQQEPEGFAFGAGPKSCLGQDLIRQVVLTVVKTSLGFYGEGEEEGEQMRSLRLQCSMPSIPIGVRGWLGWEPNVKPEDWARDVKQLPTQRPIHPIYVKVFHHHDSNE